MIEIFIFFYIYLVKQQLQSQYKDVPGRIITMALESVEYSENRACQILKIVMQDDNNKNDLKENSTAYHHAAVNKSSSRYFFVTLMHTILLFIYFIL